MPFTSPSHIKSHLLTATLPELVIRDHPVTLSAETAVELPHHNLVADSTVVKWHTQLFPLLDDSVMVSSEDYLPLQHSQLVPGSVLVTLGEPLSAVYVEEVDYQIDYAAGRIRRRPGGSLSDQQPILVYYTYYTLFERGTDYTIDEANGILTRNQNGAIPDESTVLVDYTVTSGSVDYDLITEAITAAEDVIVRNLAPEFNASSTNQGLKTGATELALSIICRAQAIDALARRATTDAAGRAKEWQQLSRFYEQQAWQTLAPFLMPFSARSAHRQSREA